MKRAGLPAARHGTGMAMRELDGCERAWPSRPMIADFVSEISHEGPYLAALDKGTAVKSNNGLTPCRYNCEAAKSRSEGLSMSMAQVSSNPHRLTRSENLRIEEIVAELNAKFEHLRQRLRKQVEDPDVDGAEHTALLMANTMSQIAIIQGAQRGDPKVISSMRQEGAFL